MKIEISLPGLGTLFHINSTLIRLMEMFPEKFYDDVFIGSVYGSFPCIWNGGRPLEGDFTKSNVEQAVQYYNSKNIKVRYTFTNLFADGDRLYDYKGNFILQATLANQTIKNDVNVANEELRKYLMKTYPDFNYIYSTTMCIKDIDKINEISATNIIVPDYTINNDFEKLKQLTHPENIELVATETCTDNCPQRRKHYISQSKFQSFENLTPITCYLVEEVNPSILNYSRITNRKHRISIKEIRDSYLPLGINKFKLVGRGGNNYITIEDYVEFFVKDEYKNEIRLDLIRSEMYAKRK